MSEPDTRTALSPDPNPATGSTADWNRVAVAADSAASQDTQTLHTTPHEDGSDRATGSAPIEPVPEPEERDSPDGLPQFVGLKVEKLLGLGGMGRVYRAVHVDLNKTLAVKLITTMGRDEKTVRERFEREIRALAKLDHPNIVPIYDAGSWHGFLYFTMKYVPAGALSKHLDRFRADPDKAARLMAKVARAVDALHAAGIIHRDLKPLNILLGDDDEPLVADFGLAKWLDDRDSDLTATHIPMGTRQYMSPEQTLGDRTRYGVGCDIWALGVTLYEMLAGGRPFADTPDSDIYEQIRSAEPPPLPESVPPELAAIIRKCMAKRPEDRYPSAAALAEDLDNWRDGPSQVVRTRRRSRNWLPALGVVGLLTVISAPALIVYLGAVSPQKEKSLVERLQNGETVTLIGARGMPLVTASTVPEWNGTLALGKTGHAELSSSGFAAVELSSEELPWPIKFRAEYAVIDSQDVRSRAGVFVGRKRTAGADPCTSLIQLIHTETPRIDPNQNNRSTEWAAFEMLVSSEDGPKERKTFPVRTRLRQPPPQGKAPLEWHQVEVIVHPEYLRGLWNGLELQPVSGPRVADPGVSRIQPDLESWANSWRKMHPTVAPPVFAPPYIGSGIGVCVFNAGAVYRNVTLERTAP